MKYEFVEFYPIPDIHKKSMRKENIGTVHVFYVDCKLDFRGIRVKLYKGLMYFYIPRARGWDTETNKEVKYPIFHFCDGKDHEEMLKFLDKEVRPIICERMGIEAGSPFKNINKMHLLQHDTETQEVAHGAE